MGRYIVRRLLWMILVIVVVTLLTFIIFFVLPSSDPAVNFAGKQPTEQIVNEVRHQLGLDHNVFVQYLIYLKHLFTGDQYGWPGFGFSYNNRDAIRDELFQRAEVTLVLIIGAAILWLAIGIPVGVISAIKRRTWVDRTLMGFALIGISAPVFWLGLISLYVFWQRLGWLPGTGYVPFSQNPADWFTHMILPWCVLALLFAAIYARIVRGNMLDTLTEDYIRTARAKGLTERRVIGRHALRASLTPVVTLLAIDLGTLVGGALVTETVFNLQGLGSWAYEAANQNDLPVALAVTVLTAFVISFLALLVDIVYAWLDPRVRLR
jgi:peptide/nickel transport system permease protein